jgi:transcriptional regulator with XRE-family HTH domain
MADADVGRGRLARLVQQQRQSLGLSVRAAARKAGVDRATWAGLEDGSRETQDRQFAGIERALEWAAGSIDAIRRDAAVPLVPWAFSVGDGTLGELIATRRNQVNLTYEQLSARASALGHEISGRTLARIANNNPPEFPGPSTLKAVAAAMDLPLADVRQAATRTAHLWPDRMQDHGTDRWEELVRDLEPAEIDHVLNVVRAVVQAIRAPDR